MKRKNLQLFLENTKRYKNKTIYTAYPLSIVLFAINISGLLHFDHYVYLGILSFLTISIMIFVPLNIKRSRMNHSNIHRNASIIYILYIIQWDTLMFNTIIDTAPYKVYNLILIILVKVIFYVVIYLVMKNVISKNESEDAKSYNVACHVITGIGLFIFGSLIGFCGMIPGSDGAILFMSNSALGLVLVYTIVRLQMQAYAYKKIEKYS